MENLNKSQWRETNNSRWEIHNSENQQRKIPILSFAYLPLNAKV